MIRSQALSPEKVNYRFPAVDVDADTDIEGNSTTVYAFCQIEGS